MAQTGIKKWLPLAVLALALFIVVLDATIINVSIKAIIGDLHTTLKTVQWVITGYSLMLAAFTITGGRLGDIFGHKRMFITGALLFAVGSLLASRAHSATALLLSVSLVEGMGAAIMTPSTVALLLSLYKEKERAVAFGVYGAIAGAAATLGPVVGGYLTTTYSWRWNYLINPMVVLLLLIGSSILRESKDPEAKRPDILSVVLSSVGLASLVYGIIESSTYGWVKAKLAYDFAGHAFWLHHISITAYSLFVGILFLLLFLWRQMRLERRQKMPLVSLKLLTNHQFITGTTVVLLAAMTQFGLVFVLPVFYQGMLGKDAFHTGLAILPLSLSILFVAPISGILVGKKNVAPRHIIQTGLIITLIGAIVLHQELQVQATVWSLVPGMILFGMGFGASFSQLANLTLSAVSVKQAGEASGVNNTFRQVGTSLGQALIGALLISALSAQLTQDVNQSRILPMQIKPAVIQELNASTQSLGADNALPRYIPRPIANEALRIKNAAIVAGARRGMLGTITVAVIALLMTIRLPKRPGTPEDLEASTH